MQGTLCVLFSCFIVLCASQGPQCRPNEKLQCVSVCPPERTCRNRFIGLSCAAESTKICQLRCVCDRGYVKNDNGECIPEKYCDDYVRRKRFAPSESRKCSRPNEFFDCGTECDNVCSELHFQNRTNCPIKNIVCNPKCYCRDGYARDVTRACVPVHQCRNPAIKQKREISKTSKDETENRPRPYTPPVKSCTGPNEYYECGPACDNVCANLHKQNRTNCPVRNIRCNSKCYCKDGYARDENWVCVPVEKCSVCNAPNEEYSCKKSCPPETCISLVARYKCDSEEVCTSRCVCKPGYLRLESQGPCVPISQCPQLKN